MNRRDFILSVGTAFTPFACSRRKVEKPNDGRRVVSLSPSTSEAMFAIGAASFLVGRSRYCDYPPDIIRLPQVGGYSDPNLEAILALAPNLVIGARGPAGPQLATKLEARGIDIYFPETETFAQIDAMILGLGDRVGRSKEAHDVVARMNERELRIARAVEQLPRLRVLIIFGIDPIVAAGSSSFPNEMLQRAGAINVVTEGRGYPQLGIERVLALDPDFIVNASMGESQGSSRIARDAPGWGLLRCVREGQVAALTDESIVRPGPRIVDGLATLAKTLHPGIPTE